MKYFSKLFIAMCMIAGLTLAGCGDKKDDGDKEKEGEKASVSDDSNVASTSPSVGEIKKVSVSFPNMT